MTDGYSEYVARNQQHWGGLASGYEAAGRRMWQAQVPSWGIWSVPESEAGLLPDVTGMDTLELGCGTGYVSSWLARRGARPVGIDPTWEQISNAQKLQSEHGVAFPLVRAVAEHLPFPDASFDLVISEYGASIWSDPHQWVPEAARVLSRPYFGMHRFEWPDDDAVEFHLGYGDWIRLLRGQGFEVTDLIELRPPEGSTTSYDFVSLEWARQWPSEQVWKARRLG